MKATLLTLGLLLCLNVSAQIHGKVTAVNGRALAGATVSLFAGEDSVSLRRTTTGDNGDYVFSGIQAGICRLKLSSVGYETFYGQPFLLKKGQELRLPTISMIALNKKLNEVVIQAKPKALIAQHIDKTVINTSALLSNTGVSAVEVLNNAPGIEISENSVSLRNRAGVSVYVDGRQVMLSGQDLVGYLKSLPSALISQVELMPNPPAGYHADGAGVINIITKKNKAPGFSGNVSAGFTQASYWNTDDNLNLYYKAGKFNLYLTTAYRKNILDYQVAQQRNYHSGALLAQNNAEVDRSASYRGRFGIDYTADGHNTFGLLIDAVTSPYHEQGDYLLQFAHLLPDSLIRTTSGLVRASHNVGVSLNYWHAFHQKDSYLNISLDQLHYGDQALQHISSATFLPSSAAVVGNYALRTDNPFNAQFYSFKADQQLTPAKIKVSAGVQGTYSIRHSAAYYTDGPGQQIDLLTNSQQADEKTGAAYISLNRDIHRFTLQAGLRYEQTWANSNLLDAAGQPAGAQQLNYRNLLPTLYIGYQPDSLSRQSLLFTFNTRIDRPGYSSLNPFVFYFDKYSSLRGNPELRPSRSTNFEFSYNTGSDFTIGTRYSLSSNPVIQFFAVSGQSLMNTNINIRKLTNIGLFTSFSISPVGWWAINSYEELYHQAYDGPLITGQAFEHHLWTYRLQLSNQFKMPHGWSAELSGYYTSRNTYGQGETMGYGRLNSSIQKKIFKGKGALVFAGQDLLHTNVIRRSIPLDGALFTRRNSYDSRRFSLTCMYNFGAVYKKQTVQSGLDAERRRVGTN